jgi:hypothetical protein
MTIYLVGGKWYYKDLNKAIERAKERIRPNRQWQIELEWTCDEDWEVKQKKNGNYIVSGTVHSDPYYSHNTTCTIRPIETED